MHTVRLLPFEAAIERHCAAAETRVEVCSREVQLLAQSRQSGVMRALDVSVSVLLLAVGVVAIPGQSTPDSSAERRRRGLISTLLLVLGTALLSLASVPLVMVA